jgi:hypothetical protein
MLGFAAGETVRLNEVEVGEEHDQRGGHTGVGSRVK